MKVWKETTAHGIWEALAKHFTDKGFANKIFLTKKSFMSQMNPLDTMEQHVNMLGAMAKEFDAVGVRVLNEVKVMVLFIKSPKSSQHLSQLWSPWRVPEACRPHLGQCAHKIAKWRTNAEGERQDYWSSFSHTEVIWFQERYERKKQGCLQLWQHTLVTSAVLLVLKLSCIRDDKKKLHCSECSWEKILVAYPTQL